jgi:hypothetical protein
VTFRVSVADLASFECQFGLALGFALDRHGLLSRFELAEELDEAARAGEEPVSGLMHLLASGLRTDLSRPAERRFQVIPGGKDADR